jgi:uncharacterized YkwD family protein
MFKKKAILTVAAVAALMMANPLQNKAEAASTNPTFQEKVYFYQVTNQNEINSILDKFYKMMGRDKTILQQITVKEPVQEAPTAETAQPAPTRPATTAPTTTAPTTAETTSTLSAYEQKVVDLTNQQRVKNGLPGLKVDLALSKVAREKSRDMSTNGYFSHTSPTYGSPFDVMKKFGITYRYAGENIAMGQRTPEEVVNAWMNSEGHRKNILSPNFTHIGVGYVAQGNYWTQQFIGK